MSNGKHSPHGFRISAGRVLSMLGLGLVLWLWPTVAYAQPIFVDSKQPHDATDASDVALGDLDGDGDLDVFVTTKNRLPEFQDALVPKDYIWFNQGGRQGGVVGTLYDSDQRQLNFSKQSNGVTLGDLDGDGDLDAFIVGESDSSAVWINQGGAQLTSIDPQKQPGFLIKSQEYPGSWLDVALADLNNDGYLDAVTLSATTTQIWLKNPVNGQFTPDQELPGGKSVALGHLNNDHTVDLIIVGSVDGNKAVWLNQGNANFSEKVQSGLLSGILTSGEAVALADINNDRFIDVLVGRGNSQSSEILINNMDAIFSTVPLNPALPSLPDNSKIIALGDLDGDSFVDAVVGTTVLLQKEVVSPEVVGKFIVAQADLPETRAIALGDIDNDGDLDLLAATPGTVVSTNNGEAIIGAVDQLWLNRAGDNFQSGQNVSTNGHRGWDVAFGYVNKDKFLDAVVYKYLDAHNCGFEGWLRDADGKLSIVPSITEQPVLCSNSPPKFDLSDLNGDNYLDIFASDGRVYTYSVLTGKFKDTGQQLTNILGQGVALGDLDGNGSVDAVVTDFGSSSADGFNYVWYNQNNSGQFVNTKIIRGSNGDTATKTISLGVNGQAVALGDLDKDGDLDAVITTRYEFPPPENLHNTVWFNQGDGEFIDCGQDLGFGGADVELVDVDKDGDLDVIVTRTLQRTDQVWLNQGLKPDGTCVLFQPKQIFDTLISYDLATGDLDGDRDMDAFAISHPTSAADDSSSNLAILWRNYYFGNPDIFAQVENSPEGNGFAVALGDLDRDGDLDAMTTGVTSTTLYLNRSAGNLGLTVAVDQPRPDNATAGVATSAIITTPIVKIPYELHFDPDVRPAYIQGYYSLDGGGKWLTATPTNDTKINDFPPDYTGEYHWNTTLAPGFFGQSDNVVFRLEAYLQFPITTTAGLYRYPNMVAGSYPGVYASSVTLPFRLRGTQVRVQQAGKNLPGAIVYHLPKDHERGALPYSRTVNEPFTTDAQGYLQGRDMIAVDDRLRALSYVTSTQSYTVYYTSKIMTVTQSGIQTLTVSAADPLILFNMDVSVEADVRNDPTYRQQLEKNLQRTSELIYDLTNGQAALGPITVYDGKAHWDDADLRIHASNQLRPHATIGGGSNNIIITNTTTNTVLVFGPGYINMGSVWNRYGEAGNDLGEDWARTLAHELGHYFFFLLDNYVGVQDGLLTRVDDCPGMMSNPYTDADSEFLTFSNWNGDCLDTLSEHFLGQEDWATLRRFYPWLHLPAGPITNIGESGPGLLPLAVTQVCFVVDTTTPVRCMADTTTAGRTLETPIFTLAKRTNGIVGLYQPSSKARAYLFLRDTLGNDQRLIDLGAPHGNQIQVWNARPADRFCVFDPTVDDDNDPNTLPKPYGGCQLINAAVRELTLEPSPDNWPPPISLTPVTSRTVEISMTGSVAGLSATVYASGVTPFAVPINNGVGTIQFITDVFSAYVYVFDPAQPNQGTVVDYTLGGGPLLSFRENSELKLRGGEVITRTDGSRIDAIRNDRLIFINGAMRFVRNGQPAQDGILLNPGDTLTMLTGDTLTMLTGDTLTMLTGDALALGDEEAPVRSNDGQVMVYGQTNLQANDYYILQTTSSVPTPPPYATVIGQAYRLTATPQATQTISAALSIRYLGRHISAQKEADLRIYFWNDTTQVWELLPETKVDMAHNLASAYLRGKGIYALMYSEQIPLQGPGWNTFAYTLRTTNMVADALASLDDYYTIVWGYDPDPMDGRYWQSFSPQITQTDKYYNLVNNLTELKYGQGYWIHMNQDSILLLRDTPTVVAANVDQSLIPPAVFYGDVLPAADFAPVAGMEVTAWVGDKLCGQSQVQERDGQLVFAIQVAADPGCGGADSLVAFRINGTPMLLQWRWDNTAAIFVPLTTHLPYGIYIPIITRTTEPMSLSHRIYLPMIKR